jgi:hypothetical protein
MFYNVQYSTLGVAAPLLTLDSSLIGVNVLKVPSWRHQLPLLRRMNDRRELLYRTIIVENQYQY